MLEVDVTNCIRDSNEAELPPRDRDVLAALQASARRLAARGLAGSGNALHERARIGCDELTVRAEIIWRQIQRCHVAFTRVYDDHLGVGLSGQIAERVTAQAAVVLGMVDSGPSLHVPERAKTFVRDAVATRRDELIKKLHSEVRFFVQAALRAPNARPGAITIHGNVGAVQTGAYAQAHINIDAAGSAHLVESLE